MEKKKSRKKYSCPDCTFCQCCSETRCAVCRQPVCKKGGKDKNKKIHKPLFRSY